MNSHDSSSHRMLSGTVISCGWFKILSIPPRVWYLYDVGTIHPVLFKYFTKVMAMTV